MKSSARYFAPGKLFIAGEYAVLKPEGKAILVPVKKGIRVQAAFHKRFRIRNAQRPKENQSFSSTSEIINPRIRLAVEVSRLYLESKGHPWQPFSLIIQSNISSQDMKYGLGSSGAVIVATIGAILSLFSLEFDALTLFKLAVKANHDVMMDSSFADLAISSFKVPLLYSRFNEKVDMMLNTNHIPTLIQNHWEGLVIQPIPIPTKDFVVVFSGVSSDSTPLISQVKPHLSEEWVQASNTLIDAWLVDPSCSLTLFSMHLRALATHANVAMFTPEIEQLLTWAKANSWDGKFSGAGGGDCVIIRIPKARQKEALATILPPYQVLKAIISV